MYIVQDLNDKNMYSTQYGWDVTPSLYLTLEDVDRVIRLNKTTHSWQGRNIIIHRLTVEKSGKLHEFI